MAGHLYDDMPNGLLHCIFTLIIGFLGGAGAVASGRGRRQHVAIPTWPCRRTCLVLAAVLRFLNYACSAATSCRSGFIVALSHHHRRLGALRVIAYQVTTQMAPIFLALCQGWAHGVERQ